MRVTAPGKKQRKVLNIFGLRKLATAVALSHAVVLQPMASAEGRPSLLEVPVELDLTPAFEAAERLVPQQAGGPRWNRWHGLKVRYQAWRGPLSMELRGDVLRVQAHVRYRAQGRKELIGDLAISTGCGVDEPPRQAIIGAAIRLSVAPDWTLRLAFRLLPTRFIDRCEITALGIDVSPLVEQVFQKRLREALNTALGEAAPALDELRTWAARGWTALQTPRQLQPGLWLTAHPQALAIAPPLGQGRRLATVVGVTLQPVISTTEPAALAPRTLPPLTLIRPVATGMHFDLVLDVSLSELSAAVARRLVGQTFEVRDVRLNVADASLSVAGDRLVLIANIDGEISGRLDVRGQPALDAHSGAARFDDLDFVFESNDPDADLIIGLFHERIRDHLQQMADEALAERLDAAMDGLQAQVDSLLSGRGRADLSGLRPTALWVDLDDQQIRLRGRAQGEVKVELE